MRLVLAVVVLAALCSIVAAVEGTRSRHAITRARSLDRLMVGDGGGGDCHDQSEKGPGHQKCVEKFVSTGINAILAKKRCNCNGHSCKQLKCQCRAKSLGMGPWCYKPSEDVAVVEPVVPDRRVGNDDLKIGWEIEFSNPVNCYVNIAGVATQCILDYKQTFATLNGWDLTTDNHLKKAGTTPAEVLNAIGKPPAAQFSDVFVVEMKPHEPIVLNNLKAAIINLAKTYETMRAAPQVWLHNNPIPVSSKTLTYAENDNVAKDEKATADEAKWGQFSYDSEFEVRAQSTWWVDNEGGVKPSGNPPQITMGFLLSDFNPTKNPFIQAAMSTAVNPNIVDKNKKSNTLQQLLSALNFGSAVSDPVLRSWLTFLFYFAERTVNPPLNKQSFDPLPKFDICQLSAKILTDSGLTATTTALKIDPILADMGDGAKMKTAIQTFLDKAKLGKACRSVPPDTSVFPYQALPNKDYLVVMELRNPTGPCVDLVNFNNLKLKNNDLDETSTTNFNKCWKALQ